MRCWANPRLTRQASVVALNEFPPLKKKQKKNKVVLACFSKENTICDLNQRQIRSIKVLIKLGI
jgi:hypothetical protein